MSMVGLIDEQLSDETLVRASEVARWLGVDPSTVYAWCEKGLLPQPMQFGPKMRKFRVGELRAALRKMDGKPASKKRR